MGPKNFRPISLLCDFFKLCKHLFLNHLSPLVEKHLIPKQDGFLPGKSCTYEVLNITQHIANGFENGLVTGAMFVNLSTAYDTVNYQGPLTKIYNMIKDHHLVQLTISIRQLKFSHQIMWEEQLMETTEKQHTTREHIRTNIFQHPHEWPADPSWYKSFICADDLCVTAQVKDFIQIEAMLISALSGLSVECTKNPNCVPTQPKQMSLFHLWNPDTNKQFIKIWNRVSLAHCWNPAYLGVTLDHSVSFKAHVEKIKGKASAWNNILRKLANSIWKANPAILRTTALALCY